MIPYVSDNISATIGCGYSTTSRPCLRATKLGIKIDPKWITGKLAEEIFERVTDGQLNQPIFVKGYPVDTSPLVRAHRDIPGLVEKWDLYIEGLNWQLVIQNSSTRSFNVNV